MKHWQKQSWLWLALVIILGVVLVVWLVQRPNTSYTKRPAGKITKDVGSCAEVRSKYIGLSKADALAKAQLEKRTARITMEDGRSLPINSDFVPERLDFTLDNGHVSQTTCG